MAIHKITSGKGAFINYHQGGVANEWLGIGPDSMTPPIGGGVDSMTPAPYPRNIGA